MRPTTNISLIWDAIDQEAQEVSAAEGCKTIDLEIESIEGDTIHIEGVVYCSFETKGANYIGNEMEMEYPEYQELDSWDFEGEAFTLSEEGDGEKVRVWTAEEINE